MRLPRIDQDGRDHRVVPVDAPERALRTLGLQDPRQGSSVAAAAQRVAEEAWSELCVRIDDRGLRELVRDYANARALHEREEEGWAAARRALAALWIQAQEAPRPAGRLRLLPGRPRRGRSTV